MNKPKKTEYEHLKEIWYKKLEDSGFKDIEYGADFSGSSTPRSAAWNDPDLRQVLQDYYCMAYYFLNEYKFDRELDKVMWEYHAEGLTIREIVRLLKQVKIKIKVKKTKKIRIQKVTRTLVWLTIKKLEVIMKGLYLSR